MKSFSIQNLGGVLLLMCVAVSHAFGGEQLSDSERLEFFEKQVRPLLAKHCYECHSVKATRVEASLLLDSLQGHLDGGDSGPAIVPGDADASLLIESVRYDSYEMPPSGKLADKEIQTLVRWVQMGAPWPDEAAPTSEGKAEKFDLEKRKSEFWVWQPVSKPALPNISNLDWPSNEIDHFIMAKLEDAGLNASQSADRLAILRRVHFDLVGLPPSPQDITDFLQDTSEGALERVVDRLLQSPHFGERWGRHWLDLVRYAESRGHEFDNDTPNAYQYRDYVIRALNEDVPYDQFVREHIAGDLLDQPRLHPEQRFNESILGTGFWFLGEWVHSPVDIRKDEADRFDNMIDVMSKTFLGVTVACARCHDHKFDAISTADYYSLSGFLQSSDYRQVRFEAMEQNRLVADELSRLDHTYQQRIVDLLASQDIKLPTQASYVDDEAIVFDYASLPQKHFLQDGYVFGKQPRREGMAYLKEQGSGIEVARFAAAVNDPIWNGLESITRGVIKNTSAVARLPKSGRTLRSPTFELEHGSVSCLVEGEGHVVACVDSHRLVAGPLHGETVKQFKAGQRWVKLNLQRYVGHRLHLEFVPASGKQISVRLVAQGLDSKALEKLDERIQSNDQQFEAYAQAAERILNSGSSLKVEERVFADFESGTYDKWTVTGEAFGTVPQTLKTIAPYQGKINGIGGFFVNSHNIRPGGDVRKGDSLTGTLTSPEFAIDFDFIEFLVGGGPHKGKTCVNLLVDGKVVRSATGKANNQMSLNTWDVRELAGKKARIQAVDDHQSGWGNIGFDHIVFKKVVSAEVDGEASSTKDEETTNEVVEKPTSVKLPVSSLAQRIIAQWRQDREQLAKRIVRKSHVAMAMLDGTGEDDRILIRGNSSKPGKVEGRHFLTAVAGNASMAIPSGSGRLELANQIVDSSNPLTYRVVVNRVWHHLMGRGIVPTVDDFGVLGQRPTHPELLDHLVEKFLSDGRSIKRLIKYIVLSKTYQMSSVAVPQSVEADPKNTLWHHCPPRRLQGEAIRDALLSLSGKLNPEQFGPPVPIHLTPFMDGRGRPKKSGPIDGDGRRSIYVAVRRNFLSPFMLTFDTPVPFSSMGRRNVSNVPAQALILMNDPLVKQLAEAWGSRSLSEVEGSGQQQINARIEWMYVTGFGRRPTEREATLAAAFIESQASQQEVDAGDKSLWANLAHVLVNTKEFIFLR